MSLHGQASGGWTESSSALRILHVSIRNTVGVLSTDCFTQTNPPAVTTNVSAQVNQLSRGALSGSVAFTRPDEGSNYIGGPGVAATQAAMQANASVAIGFRALGVFLNSAAGNAYENTPGVASGKGAYTCAGGCYGSQLFETALIANSADAVNSPAGSAITYITGQALVASRNGYLMPSAVIGGDGGIDSTDVVAMTAESFVRNTVGSATVIGVLKMPADAVQNEIIFDQRI